MLTEEQKKVIRELRKEKQSYEKVAVALNIKNGTVRKWCTDNQLGGYNGNGHGIIGRRNDNTFVERDGYIVGTDTKGREFYFDKEDMPKVIKRYWFVAHDGYAHASHKVREKDIWLHRYLLDTEPGKEVDHINHKTNDCRKSNMRVCSHKENMRNVKLASNNKSGYKGVGYHYTKWRVRIVVDGKSINVGRYETAEAAHEAYAKASEFYHGKFGCIG